MLGNLDDSLTGGITSSLIGESIDIETENFLLLEDGSFLLQEDDSKFLLENSI